MPNAADSCLLCAQPQQRRDKGEGHPGQQAGGCPARRPELRRRLEGVRLVTLLLAGGSGGGWRRQHGRAHHVTREACVGSCITC